MKTLSLAILLLQVMPLSLEAQQEDVQRVTVFDLTGRSHVGTLQQFTDSSVTIAGETTAQFQLDDVLLLQWKEAARRVAQNSSLVLLAGGDRVVLTPQTIDEDDLTGGWAQFPAWPSLKIPLERVQAVAFQLPENMAARQRVSALLSGFKEKRDVVTLQNGDRLAGQFLSLAADSLAFEGPVGKLAIPRKDIQSLAFNTELVSSPKQVGQRLLLELSDGSRLTVKLATLVEQGLLEVETQFGGTLRLPTTALLSLRLLGRRAVYLSDLKSVEFEHTPYLKSRWPLQRDRNVTGGPLRVGGREYAKGLGLHSRSSVSYDLGGKFRTFRAVVGIDDSAGDKGSVRFGVEADGKRLFTSELLTGADKPIVIGPIDVGGKQRLTLIVEFGDLGDILDRADWCDAVLIR